MLFRRPLRGISPKSFPLLSSTMPMLILFSVRLITPGSNSQPVGLVLEQCKTQLYVIDRFGRNSWTVLHLIFSHCWNTYQTWDQWCSALICWAVTCGEGVVVIWLWGGESQHCQRWRADRWLRHELSEIMNYELMYGQILATPYLPFRVHTIYTPANCTQPIWSCCTQKHALSAEAVAEIPPREVPVASPETAITSQSPKKCEQGFELRS